MWHNVTNSVRPVKTSYDSIATSNIARKNATPAQYLNPLAYGGSIRWALS